MKKVLMVNEVTPAYTYYLEPNINEIRRLANSRLVSKKKMIKAITAMITPATLQYVNEYGAKCNTKKAKFLWQINSKHYTKQSILKRCETALKRAKLTPAKQNTDLSLAR